MRTRTPCVSLVFSRYPSRPAWSLRSSSHIPCVGSLFSRYPSRPAWSLRGSSHTPCMGSLFSRYPSRLAWSVRSSSHTPCVGSLFSGSGGRSAGHGDRQVGLWREIICNLHQLRSTLQATCAPPCRTSPMELPSFQSAVQRKTSRTEIVQNKSMQEQVGATQEHQKRNRASRRKGKIPLFHLSFLLHLYQSCYFF